MAASGKPQLTEGTQNPPPSAPAKPAYGDVIITLENCLLPDERLQPTPSSLDGLDPETELDLRILGCELIQTAGILLRLPQVAMATGQVLFHRFYYSKSFVRHPMEVTAMACVCLASKVEEAPRRIRDIISVFNHIKQVKTQKPLEPILLDQNYINLKNQVIKAERRVLKELGFCVHVKHPHKMITTIGKLLKCEDNRKMMQLAWNYMNDSLRTDVFVRYSPETIACACIYLSSRKLNIPLPKKPAWYLLFGCTELQLKDICIRLMKLYNRPKPDGEKLDQVVAKLRDAYHESRLKLRLTTESEPAQVKQQLLHSPAVGAAQTAAAVDGQAASITSAASTPAVVKGEDKNHSAVKRSRTRSRSRSRSHSDKHRKSRHHRKKRSKSRSRSRSRSRSHEKRRDRDRDRRKRDSRERDRDYKHRKEKERERDRRSRRDRSLSRDRRR